MSPRKHRPPRTASIEEMFRTEVETHCAALYESLLALEKKKKPHEALQNLMRAAHSIKGAARILKHSDIERIAHAMEDCFVLTQHGTVSLAPDDIGVLLKTTDAIGQAAANLEQPPGAFALDTPGILASLEKISLQGSSEHPSKTALPSERLDHDEEPSRKTPPDPADKNLAIVPQKDRSLRVTAEALNRLLGLAGDSLVESRWLRSFTESMLRIGRQQNEAEHIIESVCRMLERVSLPKEVRDNLEQLSRKVAGAGSALRDSINDLQAHERQTAQVSHRLYIEVLRTRMRPFSDISAAYPRMVRDIALSLGKEVRLDITGETTQVDREVLVIIEPAIAHLILNAVDHGCETPNERRQAGKPPECSVRLSAQHRAGMLVVSVADDGRGVDPELLRNARNDPRFTRHPDSSAPAELLDMLLLPGFTLRRSVTEFSGRGVGLDLVHNVARKLRGSLRIENDPGHGMRFTLQLPITISVLRALVFVAFDELYAVALSQAARVKRISLAELVSIQGKRHLRTGREHVPFASARNVFGYPPEALRDHANVILLGERKPRAALAVDALIGERELVVRPLDPRLGTVRNLAGAALTDDGAPVLIVEPDEMIQSISSLAGG